MKDTGTTTAPPTVHRCPPTSSVLGLGTYRWIVKRGERVVGYFGSRKQAEDFIRLSATYR